MNAPDERPVPKVPPLSRAAAEARALAIDREFRPDLLLEAGPFPVPEFFEYHLVERYGLKTGLAELPLGVEGVTEPDGVIKLASEVYDLMHDGQPRARYTAVHEGIHGIQHVPVVRGLQCEILAGNAQPRFYRAKDLPAYRSPEWQANRISAGVLMPWRAVKGLVRRYGRDVDAMMETFLVSRRAAEVRLAQLGEMGWLS